MPSNSPPSTMPSSPTLPVPRPRAPRPPRIQIHTGNGSVTGSIPPTSQIPPSTAQMPPFSAQTNPTAVGPQGQPYWPPYANPFASGNFMSKGFDGFVDFTKSGMSFGEKFTFGLYNKFSKLSKKWFTHIFLCLVMLLYSVGGAVLFQTIEERPAEQKHRDIHRAQQNLLKEIRNLAEDHEMHRYRIDEFNGHLIYTLRSNQDAIESLLNTNKTVEELAEFSNPWSFWNAMFYCGTIYTTIGYGHITPQTTLGRSLTIIYSIIGIPMFLILLADFGKLFTRAIKFLWAYVRRIYYTGTCRKVRKQQQVLDVISGFNTMYDYAVRRPSQYFHGYPMDEEAANPANSLNNGKAGTPQTPLSFVPGTPTSPYPETFEVDDEFNLPISLASIILISYIVFGASVYTLWENWSYFEAFYFVFISMSTIGFGDFVPNHPIFMMCSIIYLIFGLALTSMFINVVQIKLSDTFKDASAKIGATIGLSMAEGSESHIPTPSDIASVHQPKLDTIGEDADEDVYPNDTLTPPQSIKLGPASSPVSLKKAPPLEIEEKPKKKKAFFRK